MLKFKQNDQKVYGMRVCKGFRLTYPLMLWISLVASVQAAAPLSGRVVGVKDGDTLSLWNESQGELVIRLAAIDAPEIGHGRFKPGQPFGMRSKVQLSTLCFDRQATVDLEGGKTYGRLVGYVRCADKDVNLEMLKAGLAWVYPRFNKGAKRDQYEQAQALARSSGVGLWSDPTPVSPWTYRNGVSR